MATISSTTSSAHVAGRQIFGKALHLAGALVVVFGSVGFASVAARWILSGVPHTASSAHHAAKAAAPAASAPQLGHQGNDPIAVGMGDPYQSAPPSRPMNQGGPPPSRPMQGGPSPISRPMGPGGPPPSRPMQGGPMPGGPPPQSRPMGPPQRPRPGPDQTWGNDDEQNTGPAWPPQR